MVVGVGAATTSAVVRVTNPPTTAVTNEAVRPVYGNSEGGVYPGILAGMGMAEGSELVNAGYAPVQYDAVAVSSGVGKANVYSVPP